MGRHTPPPSRHRNQALPAPLPGGAPRCAHRAAQPHDPLYTPGETDIFAFARTEGVGVLIKQALGQGLLLGADHDHHRNAGDHRSRKPVDPDLSHRITTAVAAITSRFGPTRSDLARVALRYVLETAPDATVLVGFRNSHELTEVLSRADEPLTEPDMTYSHTVMTPVREGAA